MELAPNPHFSGGS